MEQSTRHPEHMNGAKQAERKPIEDKCALAQRTWFLAYFAPFMCSGCLVLCSIFCAMHSQYLQTQNVSRLEKALKQFIMFVVILVLCMYVSSSIAGSSLQLQGTIRDFCVCGLFALALWMYFELGTKTVTTAVKSSRFMRTVLEFFMSEFVRGLVLLCVFPLVPMLMILNVMNQQVRRLRG